MRQWNERGWRPALRFVTPAEVLERIKKLPREKLPVVNGDWTDYWNFGAGSSAAETRLTMTARDLGLSGYELETVLRDRLSLAPDFEWRAKAADAEVLYIHRRIGDADVYFVSNQKLRTEPITARFRVAGRQPELWDPLTGSRRALGAFEGAAYEATGYYRAQANCMMFTRHTAFCAACRRAIERVIDLYAAPR